MFDDALFMAPPKFDQKRGRKNPFDLAIFELNSKCEISCVRATAALNQS